MVLNFLKNLIQKRKYFDFHNLRVGRKKYLITIEYPDSNRGYYRVRAMDLSTGKEVFKIGYWERPTLNQIKKDLREWLKTNKSNKKTRKSTKLKKRRSESKGKSKRKSCLLYTSPSPRD